MESIYKRISRIENFFSMLLAKSGVSTHFFINNLPKEIDKSWDDMVYVDVNGQTERGAYTTGSANIYLYTRPIGAYYRKDVAKMDEMEEKLDAAIKAIRDPHYTVQVNWRDSEYDDDIEFYFNVINVSVIVK